MTLQRHCEHLHLSQQRIYKCLILCSLSSVQSLMCYTKQILYFSFFYLFFYLLLIILFYFFTHSFFNLSFIYIFLYVSSCSDVPLGPSLSHLPFYLVHSLMYSFDSFTQFFIFIFNNLFYFFIHSFFYLSFIHIFLHLCSYSVISLLRSLI